LIELIKNDIANLNVIDDYFRD